MASTVSSWSVCLRDPALSVLVLGSLLNSFAFFATLPFLSLYLSDISPLPAPLIGAVVGSIAVVSSVGGILGGVGGDRLGAVPLVRLGVVLDVLLYGALAMVHRIEVIVVLVVGLGVARMLVEPSMKKLMSAAAPTGGGVVFRIRYITLCLGAVVGPVVGAALYRIAPTAIFVAPAVLFAGFLLLTFIGGTRLRAVDAAADRDAAVSDPRVALGDGTLMTIIAAGFVVFVVFSQFESILPLYLKDVDAAGAVGYFSALLVTNALLAIVMQFPVERISHRWSTRRLALLGCGAFAVSLPLLGTSSIHPALPFVGVLAWTVGEAILLPMPDTMIHDIAPASVRGSYFGLAELRYLGFFVGPVVGGAVLTIDPRVYFAGLALFVLAAFPLLSRAATRIHESSGEASR